MTEVSVFRLYLLRASYLLLVVGLGLTVWPDILHHTEHMTLSHGVVRSLLGAVGALALVGLRYPLQMIPLLIFEMTWKAIWLAAFALPLFLAHQMDAGTQETVWECAIVAIFLFTIPWGYVFANYVKKPGDRWW